MKEIKLMVVPGRVVTVPLKGNKMTVIDAAKEAAKQLPNIDWLGMVDFGKGGNPREVRVQNRKFSNVGKIPPGYFGSVHTTPLKDNDVVLIITKISGNDSPGLGVLTCTINGDPYALETPEQVGIVLEEAAGINEGDVQAVHINGEKVQLDQLVGDKDAVTVELKRKQPVKKVRASKRK